MLPYLTRYGFEKATSIHASRAVELSIRLLDNAANLFRRLGELVGSEITADQLAFQSPRFSYPFPSVSDPEINLNEPVVTTLLRSKELVRRN